MATRTQSVVENDMDKAMTLGTDGVWRPSRVERLGVPASGAGAVQIGTRVA
jgi:hypothetical protein